MTNVTDQTDSGTGVAGARSVATDAPYRSTPEALAEVRAEVRKISDAMTSVIEGKPDVVRTAGGGARSRHGDEWCPVGASGLLCRPVGRQGPSGSLRGPQEDRCRG